jgi:hypothetical protein
MQRSEPPDWGFDVKLTTLFCKKDIVAKSIEVKTGCSNSRNTSEGDYGSRMAVLPIIRLLL